MTYNNECRSKQLINDLQTNLAYFVMINYDQLWQFFARPLRGNFFTSYVVAKEPQNKQCFPKIELNWKITSRISVPEDSSRMNKIGTRKPKLDGAKVKNYIFANLAVCLAFAFLRIYACKIVDAVLE